MLGVAVELEGHTFLISGGGSGLGAATAHVLVAGGARVLLADIDAEAGARTAAALGSQAHFIATDVTSEPSVAAAVAAASTHFGALHGAICCAGIATGARVLGKSGPHSLELFTRTIMVNLAGVFNVVRLAAAAMEANPPGPSGERGVIVNTASAAAFDGQIGQAAYAASKGGVAAMTLPLARELARIGVRVMTIAPGTFDTPMVAGMSAELRQSLAAQVPFPSRLGRPEEFGQLVRHIIENQMLNGEVIRLDGAIRMAPK
jgi:NAD(P)-dependent dehydrogenase (short-subunit alcohol dehydrogenase family)